MEQLNNQAEQTTEIVDRTDFELEIEYADPETYEVLFKAFIEKRMDYSTLVEGSERERAEEIFRADYTSFLRRASRGLEYPNQLKQRRKVSMALVEYLKPWFGNSPL